MWRTAEMLQKIIIFFRKSRQAHRELNVPGQWLNNPFPHQSGSHHQPFGQSHPAGASYTAYAGSVRQSLNSFCQVLFIPQRFHNREDFLFLFSHSYGSLPRKADIESVFLRVHYGEWVLPFCYILILFLWIF